MVLTRLRKMRGWFFRALDSEGVALFQIVVYAHFAAAGSYGLFIARGAPLDVMKALGPGWATVWLWMQLGMLLCLVGKVLVGCRALKRAGWYTAGMWLQLCGDVCAFGAFFGYVLATLQNSEWGERLTAVWGFAALSWCALFLVVRDVRRIHQAEMEVRQ